ncbi:uncharacterized protein N7511_003510 [Penicillium nucicola]|uniref:uncharacterized protein n=1 Tax=Penicillium nucicola TaxID=1850975 RepID=UPI0025456ED5|nr:uncharacterized protein N7511_003510 [Penicillium nucicola]KAJ5771459.1 hypothetical protein N7511_003510 [Penicillium nucicola]
MNEDIDLSPGYGNSQSKSDICGKESEQQPNAEQLEEAYLPDPTTSPNPSSKLPIPRLHKPASPLQRRIPRACAPCRASKSKCTGEKPRCQRCMMLQHICQYPARKRDETQRKLEQLSAEAYDYKCVLQLLYRKVNVEDADTISAVLFKVCTE